MGDAITISPALKRVTPTRPERSAPLIVPKAELARWPAWEGRTDRAHLPPPPPVRPALGQGSAQPS